jgi:protein disulfide-isomerase A1
MNYQIYIIVILALLIAYVLYGNNSQPIVQEKENFASEPKSTLKLYYTSWCGWSQKFLPIWEQLKDKVNTVAFEKIDCEKNKDMCSNIPGYPYLILEKNGEKITYNGDRSMDDVIKFLNHN